VRASCSEELCLLHARTFTSLREYVYLGCMDLQVGGTSFEDVSSRPRPMPSNSTDNYSSRSSRMSQAPADWQRTQASCVFSCVVHAHAPSPSSANRHGAKLARNSPMHHCGILYGDTQSMLSCLLVSQAAGSAAVDLTNLFLNPQKPSAINVWHVSVCT
jgi:hypothetical protein